MIKKTYSKTGSTCRVTFRLSNEVKAKKASLCGEFNDWDPKAHPMKKLKDGSFSLTVSLAPEKSYRFRYRLDGNRWENDWEPDGYLPNEFGSEDSVVNV